MKTGRIGFSLIEMAIVIAITGLLMAAFLQFYAIEMEASRLEVTRKRLDELRTALTIYVASNDRLPCPASPPGVGVKKDKEDTVSDSCAENASPPPGTEVFGTAEGKDEIWIGVIPARDLRLSNEQVTDGWGNRFTYAVTRRLTQPGGMKGNPTPTGVLKVIDSSGNDLLDAPGTGRYVIASHGRTGKGAWTQSGGKKSCDRDERDGENCNGNATFMISSFALRAGENFYDDVAIHDDADVRGTLLDGIIVCNAKKAFYDPAAASADQDGCMRQEGVWEGACLRSFTLDDKGSEVTVEVRAVLAPAIDMRPECGCRKGYKSVRIGAWDDGVDGPYLSTSNGPDPQNKKSMPKRTALYTCVN
ncbi:MAG: type II secretion system protein [Alphaproteobacteria bacterium]